MVNRWVSVNDAYVFPTEVQTALDTRINTLAGNAVAAAGTTYIEASAYGAVGNDSTDCTTALANAKAAALAADKPLHIAAGTYKITGALNLKGDGLTVIGDGMFATTIKQYTANTPIIQVGGQAQNMHDFGLQYALQQTSAQTSGNCIEFYTSYFSHFSDIYTYGGARHYYIPQVNDQSTGQNGAFSNLYENLRMLGATISFIDFAGYIGYYTASQWNNIYINNKVGSQLTLSGPAVTCTNGDGIVFNVLNIEDIDLTGGSDKVLFIGTKTAEIQGLHFERVKLAFFGAALVTLSSCDAQISGTASYCEITGTGNGARSMFKIYQARLRLGAWDYHNILRESGTTFYVFDINSATNAYVSAEPVTPNALSTLSSTSTMGTTGVTWATGQAVSGTIVNEVTYPGIPVVRRFNDQLFHYLNAAGKNVLFGTAAPTTGTWAVGDTVWNTAPAAAGAPGWVCTAAGTPGTWKAMASLAA